MGETSRKVSVVPGPTLATLLARRVEAWQEHAPAARRGDAEAVHQARVASRRLREAVPVLATGLAGVRIKPLRRRLRDMTRALGAVRELDVALAMVGDLDLASGGELRDAWVRQLEKRRRRPERTLRAALRKRERTALDALLADLVRARAADDDTEWRAALARRLSGRARALAECIDRAGATYAPEPLHDVRIAGKRLRYSLELVTETELAEVRAPLRTLKRAQEALGRLHDLDVLLGTLQHVPRTAAGGPLSAAAEDAVALVTGEATTLHRQYLRARPSLTRVTARTLDEVVRRVRVTRIRSRDARSSDAD